MPDSHIPQNTRKATRPVLTVDYERYAPMLDDPALTEAQKQEILQALWMIICDFVAMGFTVTPSCDQNPADIDRNS